GPDRVSQRLQDVNAQNHDGPGVVDDKDLGPRGLGQWTPTIGDIGGSLAGDRTARWRPVCSRRAHGVVRKASAAVGSNCVPASRPISSSAAGSGRLTLYGRSDVIASNASATVTTRAIKGMSSPLRPSG